MDQTRYVRWVNASQCLSAIEPYMLVVTQGFGRLDAKLVTEDLRRSKLLDQTRDAALEGLRLMDHLTLSYLWVLGIYELVRTLAQRVRHDPSLLPHPMHSPLVTLKQRLERLRIPLAKMEPATRHKDTDAPIAFPAISPTIGLAWQVSSDHFVPRRELSDACLEFLEQLSSASTTT